MQRSPPRLSAAAFNAAASHSPALPRRPRLHLIVLHADAALLRHAHNALVSASRKGIHVFLQPQVHTPHSAHRITPTHIPQLLAASRADYVALVAEQDLTAASIRLRLSPTADFLQLPLSQFPDAILTAWAAHCHLNLDAAANTALAMNPNVVTAAHLDAMLQTRSNMRSIRRVYATLARLVNTTQQWEPRPHAPKMLTVPTSDCIPDLISRALKTGLSSVRRARRPPSPKSDISYFWLRRSNTLPARVLRSQLLARTLHSSLLTTFSKLCMESVKEQASRDAHRQRLLREINDLLPRLEQLCSHLSKRPRSRGRRTRFFSCNPWQNYVRNAQGPRAVAGATGEGHVIMRGGGWRCCACGSFNAKEVPGCEPCGARCSDVKVEMIGKGDASQLRDAISSLSVGSKPWIFAPDVLQAQHLQQQQQQPMGNGVASPETRRERSFAVHARRNSYSPPIGGSGDLNNQFQAFSVEDNEYSKRLACSAPSGPSYLGEGRRSISKGVEEKKGERVEKRVMGASSPIAVPMCGSESKNQVEALAAASDAANGGTGSATEESMRAVSAILTAGREEARPNSNDTTSGMYNMF